MASACENEDQSPEDPGQAAAFSALLERELSIAEQADPHHCSECGRYLDRWHFGFPRPLCTFCNDARNWGRCPCCGRTVRQDPPGSGVLMIHGEADGICLGFAMSHIADEDTVTGGASRLDHVQEPPDA